MTDEYVIQPINWFSTRRLDHKPKHFVTATTPLNSDSYQWICDKLLGRYCLVLVCPDSNDPSLAFLGTDQVPSFEDPSEATLYELTWS